MDEIEVNGNDGGLNFDIEGDDPFRIPPPLDASLLVDDPANIAEENEDLNPQQDGDGEAKENAEKKKKKRAFKPRVNLNEERLCSKKGIEALKNLCSDVQFKGKGHEVSDLNKLLYRFEHWAQCLMPRWPFENVVEKCEVLGSKSKVKNELKRIRQNDEEVLRGEPEDDEDNNGQAPETNEENSTTESQQDVAQDERPPAELTEEQRERIRQNRLLAFERREAKKRQLEENSQRESQLEDDSVNSEQDTLSSEITISTNVTSENTAQVDPNIVPDEYFLEDTLNVNDKNFSMNINDASATEIPAGAVSNIEQEENHENISDDDNDDILNRSAFDLNPSDQDVLVPGETANEISPTPTQEGDKNTEILENNIEKVIEENTSLDNATASEELDREALHKNSDDNIENTAEEMDVDDS